MGGKKGRSGPNGEHRVAPERLRWRCDPQVFSFETTDDLTECPIEIIGQPRAMEALRLGLALRGPGYNIFAVGEVGSGRSTAVRQQLAEVERGNVAPSDVCYVHKFQDPDQPTLLTFPAGRGRAFQKAMEELVEGLLKNVPELFDSDVYRKKRTAKVEAAKEKQKSALRSLEKQIEKEGFALVQIQIGPFTRPALMPVVAGNPVDMDQLETLAEEGKFTRKEYDRLRTRHASLTATLELLTKGLQKLERELHEALLKLDRDLARPLVTESMAEVRETFDTVEVRQYLEDVAGDVLEHLERFRAAEPTGASGPDRERAHIEQRERLLPYAVNLIVDNAQTKGLPIIWETSPTYRNLFGAIERARDASGEWHTDHSRIKGGSLLKASGGFLVLDALDVLTEPGVWSTLKRTLRTGYLEIQSFDPLSIFAGVSLKPERVAIDTKVILIGTRHIYSILYALDEDFKKIFKVKAEFALETSRSEEELTNYACFVHKKCRDESLLPFHREALAGMVEHGVRLAGRQEKLTTRFNEIADIIREAAYWAVREHAKRVEGRHVDQAVAKRIRRLDLLAEMLRERISEGTVLVDVEGEKVGQVNGLVFLDVRDFSFGQPTRITATTAMGRSGIIDIEREAEMSGAIHTKGVLILAGFLRSRFAQDKPLALSASLCFEQNYAAIDGDSASSAELYALLSSLSGVPIRQGIAVTGSVNQRGEIQPIGGVNEKIEGYYDLCLLKGLDGKQGVMAPARNVRHLMLRKDVVEAVRKGKFHVWAVSTIEEGIEILTGVSAGERKADGRYPERSVFARVDDRLRELATAVRDFWPVEAKA